MAADRDGDTVAATVRSIDDVGGAATALVADVADPALVASMVADAADALGGLDGIVYNVGIAAGLGLADATPEAWDVVLAVNLRGAMLTALGAALPILEAGASMAFISSVAGLKPGSRIPAYDASKAALGGLMRHVALEGARQGIRANIVAPGLMDTSLGRAASLWAPLPCPHARAAR